MSLSMPLLLAVGGTKMFNLPGILSLTWCVLGYMFLDRGDSTRGLVDEFMQDFAAFLK